MTPAQFKALLDAATKRPWFREWNNHDEPDCGIDIMHHGTGARIALLEHSDGEGRSKVAHNAVAIVATMNAADALVALWEAAQQVVPAMTGCTIDKTEKFYAALRRLEELQ